MTLIGTNPSKMVPGKNGSWKVGPRKNGSRQKWSRKTKNRIRFLVTL